MNCVNPTVVINSMVLPRENLIGQRWSSEVYSDVAKLLIAPSLKRRDQKGLYWYYIEASLVLKLETWKRKKRFEEQERISWLSGHRGMGRKAF